MKLQPDRFATLAINAHGPGWVAINGQRIHHSVVVNAAGGFFDWACPAFESLSAEHFARLVAEQPELVLFGSGQRLRFPRPDHIRQLIEHGIGVETMDTAAAARTYNFLAGEGRRVVAALIVEPE